MRFALTEAVAHSTELSPSHPPAALSAPMRTGMGDVLIDPEEFQRLPEVLTLYHAKRALRRIAEFNAFSAFVLLAVKTTGSSVGVDMVTSSWPTDPCEALRGPGGDAAELRNRLAEDIQPFLLSARQATLVGTPGAAALCLPVFSDRSRGALVFSLCSAPPAGAYSDLHLYALYLFARLAHLDKPRGIAVTLAPRELDCLRWSAAGKTSGEIAAILGVSENTVNSYLAAAAQKMNAVNRVQTVAQAIRLGLLT
jgi:DNA-binding CsgD family transcriptional regulator